jgi:hypothetical protein
MVEIASAPLLDQAVLHSCRFLDSSIEKEVCDVLLLHRGQAIVIAVKAQDVRRDFGASRKWAGKSGRKGLAQVRGAYRTLRERPTWCQHHSLGRRDFAAGSIVPRHGVALVEAKQEMIVDVGEALSPDKSGVNTSLMSIDDFCNILHYLRTWRDLLCYLDARYRCLQFPDSATLGAEAALLGYYTAMRDTFQGCISIADAKLVTARGQHVRDGSAFRDREAAFATVLEELLACIAQPMELPPELASWRAAADVTSESRMATREDFCDLTIQERAALGEQVCILSARVAEEQPSDPVYGGVRFTRRKDDAYMVVVAAGRDQDALRIDAMDLIISYCVYHGLKNGYAMALNQRDEGLTFDVMVVKNVEFSLEMMAAGEEHFGHIRQRKTEAMR